MAASIAERFVPRWIELRRHDRHGDVAYRIIVGDVRDFDWYYAQAKAARRSFAEDTFLDMSEYQMFCGGTLDGRFVEVPEKKAS